MAEQLTDEEISMLSPALKVEHTIRYNAKITSMQAYNSDPTVANRKNWDDASEKLIAFISLVRKSAPSSPETFSSKKEVLEHLLADGWQIGQSQFYAHCRQMLLRPEKDGHYSLKAVEKYAAINLRRTETGQKVNDRLDRMQEERMEVELATAKVKLTQQEHDLGIKQSKFIPRDDFELAIVGRAVAFMAHLNHTIQSSVPDWIDIVSGDQARAADLVAAISEAVEQRMGDFAADVEFDVILEAN